MRLFYVPENARIRFYGSVIHERKTDSAAGAENGAAHGGVHARELDVQHRGQLFRGADRRGRDDGAVAGLPSPEPRQRGGRRIRHRHRSRGGVLPRREKERRGKPRVRARTAAVGGARRGAVRAVHDIRRTVRAAVHGQRSGRAILARILLRRHRVRARHHAGNGVRENIAGGGQDENDDVLHGDRRRHQHRSRPAVYIRCGIHSGDGRMGRRARDGHRPVDSARVLRRRVFQSKTARTFARGKVRPGRKDLPQAVPRGSAGGAQPRPALLPHNRAQRRARGVLGNLRAHTRHILQVADLHILHGQRHYTGHTPARRVQSRRGARRPRAGHIPFHAAALGRRHGRRHPAVPYPARSAHRAVHRQRNDARRGRSPAAHNKRGFHRVRPVRSYRRHVRGAGQRHAVADHFPDTLSGHYPRRSADDAAARRRGRMERVLDHRMHSRRIFLPYVRKVFQNAENESGSRVTRFRSFIIRPC